MEELIKVLRCIGQHFSWGNICGEAAAALEAANARIAELEEAQRWVPVTERLPEAFREPDTRELIPFLVCVDGTEYPFRALYDGKNWGDGWAKLPVTHWRPLPAPPRKENNEQG